MATVLDAGAAREQIRAALDAIDAAQDMLHATSSDLVGNDFRLEIADRLETQERTNRALMYRIFAELAAPRTATAPSQTYETRCGNDCASPHARSPAVADSPPASDPDAP